MVGGCQHLISHPHSVRCTRIEVEEDDASPASDEVETVERDPRTVQRRWRYDTETET
jgi:hypothetical protein